MSVGVEDLFAFEIFVLSADTRQQIFVILTTYFLLCSFVSD